MPDWFEHLYWKKRHLKIGRFFIPQSLSELQGFSTAWVFDFQTLTIAGRKATFYKLLEHQLSWHGRTLPKSWSDSSTRKSSPNAAPKFSTLNMVWVDLSSIPAQCECAETGDSSGQSRYEKKMEGRVARTSCYSHIFPVASSPWDDMLLVTDIPLIDL